MSMLSELEKRLAENEKRIGDVIQHLEAHTSLEESLRNAGNGLDEANEQVRQLVESTKVTIQSLADVLAAFQEAVEILRRSDPTRATEAVERVEERLKGVEQEITETIGKAAGEISSAQQKVVERIEERLKGVEQGITKTIGEAAGEISSAQQKVEQKLEDEGKSIRESIPNTIVYITFAVVIMLLGFEVLRHFTTLFTG